MAKPTRVHNTIRALRTQAGLTQADLAEAVGVTRQTINAIEGRKYSPSLEVAFLIARCLGHPIDAVFSYPEEPAPTVGE